jgi:hypothetical protein
VILLAELDRGVLTLQDPDTFTAFHVAVAGEVDDERLAEVLAPYGRLEDGHAWITVEAVVTLAGEAGGGGEAWREGFDGMVAYAGEKGFLSPDGSAIRAHLEPA